MQAIQEENHADDDQADHRATSIKRTQQRGNRKFLGKKPLHSLSGTDPSPCKNDLNRSNSRVGDLRLPSLIETPRGRIITLNYTFKLLFLLNFTLLID